MALLDRVIDKIMWPGLVPNTHGNLHAINPSGDFPSRQLQSELARSLPLAETEFLLRLHDIRQSPNFIALLNELTLADRGVHLWWGRDTIENAANDCTKVTTFELFATTKGIFVACRDNSEVIIPMALEQRAFADNRRAMLYSALHSLLGSELTESKFGERVRFVLGEILEKRWPSGRKLDGAVGGVFHNRHDTELGPDHFTPDRRVGAVEVGSVFDHRIERYGDSGWSAPSGLSTSDGWCAPSGWRTPKDWTTGSG